MSLFLLHGLTQDHRLCFEKTLAGRPDSVSVLYYSMDMIIMISLLEHHSPTFAHDCSLCGELQIRRFVFQEVYDILGDPIVIFR